jgi:outer membrane lipoprotein SlyB
MKKVLTALSLGTVMAFSSATILPSIAEAKTCSTHRKNTANRGTLYGAVGGALLGSAVASKGVKTEGALLGATVGGVAGHHIAKKKAKCGPNKRYYYKNGHRYYYYRR